MPLPEVFIFEVVEIENTSIKTCRTANERIECIVQDVTAKTKITL